jgi:cytochrome c-type biogenesis protein CcmH
MKKLLSLLLLGLLLGNTTLQATTTLESYKFSNQQDEQRFKSLIAQLRCLVCQNESLADSDAELAHDLRQEVYEMMLAGKTNQQVTDFLVQRYGDFVLYNPPVKPSTWLIWFGPFVVLLIAVLLLFRALRHQRALSRQSLTDEERKRLQQALHQPTGKDTSS